MAFLAAGDIVTIIGIATGIGGVILAIAGIVLGVWLSGKSERAARVREEAARARHREELSEANNKLSETNQELSEANRKLSEANQKLDSADAKFDERLPGRVVSPVPTRDDSFQGRDDSIDECLLALLLEHAVVVVSGAPGVGKTEFAAEVLGRLEEGGHGFGGGVLWMPVGRNPDISTLLSVWCRLLGVSREGDLEVDTKRVRAELERRRMLLVFDDVWSATDATVLLDLKGESCGCIVTTHEEAAIEAIRRHPVRHREVPLDAFENPDDALAALQARAGLVPARGNKKVDAFLTEENLRILRNLCELAAYMPFTVAMMGAYLAAKVFPLDDGADERLKRRELELRSAKRRLGETLQVDTLTRPGHAEHFGLAPISPDDLMSLVADALGQAERQMLEAVSILLPKPASFTASEVCGLLEPAITVAQATEQLDRLMAHCLVQDAPPLTEGQAREGNGAGSEPERRYTVHELVGWFFIEKLHVIAPEELIALRGRAVRAFGEVIEPSDEESGTDDASRKLWRSAHRLETPEWQAAAAQWIHQLAQLDDRMTARVAFDRVYLDTAWWWGCYLEEPPLGRRLIDGWTRASSDSGESGSEGETRSRDSEWITAVEQFHLAYQPVQEKWEPGKMPQMPEFRSNWPAVREALETIARLDGLGGEPRNAAERHAAALLDVFLAESVWRFDPADHYADETYGRAARLLQGCQVPECDCEWSVPWISWHLADVELERGHRSRARDHADEGLKLALAQTGDTLEEVLENWEDDLACELISNCFRARADAVWPDDHVGALNDYQQASLFALAFQYRPHAPDDYTVAFYGEMIARILARIGEWSASESGKDDAFQAAVEGLVAFGRARYPLDPKHAASPVPPRSATHQLRSEALLVQAFAPRPEPSRSGVWSAEVPPLPYSLERAVTDAITSLYHGLIPDAAPVG